MARSAAWGRVPFGLNQDFGFLRHCDHQYGIISWLFFLLSFLVSRLTPIDRRSTWTERWCWEWCPACRRGDECFLPKGCGLICCQVWRRESGGSSRGSNQQSQITLCLNWRGFFNLNGSVFLTTFFTQNYDEAVISSTTLRNPILFTHWQANRWHCHALYALRSDTSPKPRTAKLSSDFLNLKIGQANN